MSNLQIIDACENGDLDTLKQIITRENVNGSFEEFSAIEICADAGHLPCIQWLTQHMHATHIDDALCRACSSGHLECVKYLVEQCNADVNHLDAGFFSPISSSVGKYDIVNYLLARGASVKPLPPKYIHPISLHVAFGHTAICLTQDQVNVNRSCALLLMRHGARLPECMENYDWAYDYQCKLDAARLRCARSCAALFWALRARGMPKCLGGHMVRTYVLPTWVDDKWNL